MNRSETAALLTMRATWHGVKVGESDVEAWYAVVGDLDFADARDALIGHYRDSREWSMPADIRQSVRRVRKARLDAAPPAQPPPGLDPDDVVGYLRWRREQIRCDADLAGVLRVLP